MCVVREESARARLSLGRFRIKQNDPYAVNLVEAVHVELPHKTGELQEPSVRPRGGHRGEGPTLLCLKWEPRIVRLNSPTLDTTKLPKGGWYCSATYEGTRERYLVPCSVQLMN